jgi:hypothetical protein
LGDLTIWRFCHLAAIEPTFTAGAESAESLAHAVVAGLTLLTRDARRYPTYFPKLRVIAP